MELVAHAWIDVPFSFDGEDSAVDAIQRNAQEVLDEFFTERARPMVQMRYGGAGDGFPYLAQEARPSGPGADARVEGIMKELMTDEEYQGFLKGRAIECLAMERTRSGSGDLSRCAEYIGRLREEAERNGR